MSFIPQGVSRRHFKLRKTKLDISVVIPVYNSAQTLVELSSRLLDVLKSTSKSFEIIFVDDGSQDNSWETLQMLQANDPSYVVIVQLMRNYGQHNALMCGFRKSRGSCVITLDDDLQNPPEEIPKLLKEMECGNFDLVYGNYESKKHDHWRNIGTWLVLYFYKVVFKSSVEPTSYRVIRRELLNSIFSYNLNFTYIDGLLAWNTVRIGRVLVDHSPRGMGSSGYSLSRLMSLALNLFTNFSLLPLQVVSFVGILASTLGLVGGGYYLILYISSDINVPGYASTIIAVLTLGGVQLMSLGIIGEYLGRLHLNVNNKPQYVIRGVIDADGVESPNYISQDHAKHKIR